MALYYDGEDVIENSGGTDYRVSNRFSTVLDTLPDPSVPKALVMVGLLTEDLTPVSGDLSRQQTIATEVTDPPAANVPAETVEAILWLLNEVRATLDADRKQTIGTILSQSGLTSPSSGDSDTLDTSDSDESETSEEISHAPPSGDVTDDTGGQSVSEASYACEFCAEGFHERQELMSHLITCGERPDGVQFACDQCSKTYHSQFALDRHVERNHGNENESGDYPSVF